MMGGFGRRGFNGYERGFHGLGILICMIIFVLLVVLVTFIVLKHRNMRKGFFGMSGVKPNIDGPANNFRAMEILNEKFALGEITEEEYLKKKELINS
jgi:putative membrane protein